MDEDEIYICFPGELVVYWPDTIDEQNTGLLCTVKGIKNGKVELLICPNKNLSILTQPNHLIECGDYGSDLYDVKDEVTSLYDNYDDITSVEMDDILPLDVSSPPKAPDMVTEMATYHYFCKNYAHAIDCFNTAPESTAGEKSLYLAKCMEKLCDNERALHYFTESFHFSGDTSAYKACCIALCFHKIDNAGEEWSWCQRALQLNHQSPMSHYVAARLLYHDLTIHRLNCTEQIQSCILHCHVLDAEQFPSEALEMWCDIAKMAEFLQCEPSLRIRAWLRAIGVCRSVGVLSPLNTPLPSTSNSRTAEAAAMRDGACMALYELGKLLESLAAAQVASGASIQAMRPLQSVSTASRPSSTGNSKNRKGSKLAASTTDSSPRAVPVGWGYVRGAYAAHFMCEEVGGGANQEHRKALAKVKSVLSMMSIL